MKTFNVDKTDSEWLKEYNQFVEAFRESKGQVEITIKPITEKKYRSNQQNKALHKYFGKMAQLFNDSGMTKVLVMAKLKECMPWCGDSVKNDIWRNFQKHLGYEESTTKLDTKKMNKVYDLCNQFLTTRLGFESIPFPNNFDKWVEDNKK